MSKNNTSTYENYKYIFIRSSTPCWEHDCDQCEYLGYIMEDRSSWPATDGLVDLWVHVREDWQSSDLIIRRSPEGSDYGSMTPRDVGFVDHGKGVTATYLALYWIIFDQAIKQGVMR